MGRRASRLERARDRVPYLTARNPATTPAGGGLLVEEAPKEPGSDRYRYDPRDPVLALFGPELISIPPAFDRNHNTAAYQNVDAALAIADQTIHHGATHLTRISLPWIRA